MKEKRLPVFFGDAMRKTFVLRFVTWDRVEDGDHDAVWASSESRGGKTKGGRECSFRLIFASLSLKGSPAGTLRLNAQ